jgi:hypothetical protein
VMVLSSIVCRVADDDELLAVVALLQFVAKMTAFIDGKP